MAPCVKFILFILGQCVNVQHFEHVIWLQKVFVLRMKSLLSGGSVLLADGCCGHVNPSRAHDGLQDSMAERPTAA